MPIRPDTGVAILLLLCLAYFPGAAVLRLFKYNSAQLSTEQAESGLLSRLDPWAEAGLACGLSLALQPLILLWVSYYVDYFDLSGRLGPLSAWALVLISMAVVFWKRDGSWKHMLREPAWRALAVLLVVLLLSRWLHARSLMIPMWGDSVHHSMITALFLKAGGLVESWQPFAPLTSFSYHFGFHATAAQLSWLAEPLLGETWPAEMAAPRSVLISGQILMVLQALTAYALVAGISGRPWAGFFAALAAGGLSSMPAYYLNWGRYTQLAGQVVFPAAALATFRGAGFAASFTLGDERNRNGPAFVSRIRLPRSWVFRLMIPTTILVAGLALTHYLITLMYAAMVLAWLILGAGMGWRAGLERRFAAISLLAPLASGSILLTLPWIPQFSAGFLGESAAALATSKVNPDVYGVVPWAYWTAETVEQNIGGLILAIAFFCALAGGFLKSRLAGLGALWMLLLLLMTYPSLLGLEITGLLKDFTVAIGLYLPLGLIIGGGVDALIQAHGQKSDDPQNRDQFGRRLALAGAALAILLAFKDRNVLNEQHRLVWPADLEAIAWIREELPSDAKFLVSAGSAFGDTVMAGDDAGWWLSQLAEPRQSTLPPITYGLERSSPPDFREQVNALNTKWQDDLDDIATIEALQSASVTHAYTGVRAGFLPREALEGSPNWRAIYNQNGVQIFEFDPEAESDG